MGSTLSDPTTLLRSFVIGFLGEDKAARLEGQIAWTPEDAQNYGRKWRHYGTELERQLELEKQDKCHIIQARETWTPNLRTSSSNS